MGWGLNQRIDGRTSADSKDRLKLDAARDQILMRLDARLKVAESPYGRSEGHGPCAGAEAVCCFGAFLFSGAFFWTAHASERWLSNTAHEASINPCSSATAVCGVLA